MMEEFGRTRYVAMKAYRVHIDRMIQEFSVACVARSEQPGKDPRWRVARKSCPLSNYSNISAEKSSSLLWCKDLSAASNHRSELSVERSVDMLSDRAGIARISIHTSLGMHRIFCRCYKYFLDSWYA